jgi:flagellar biosynthesis/type III secretory pathway chaperone
VMKREIEEVKTDIRQLREVTVQKAELLETMKRVEQQLEIMMLRAGIRPTSRLTE